LLKYFFIVAYHIHFIDEHGNLAYAQQM
jgi:hypothetical protein